MAPLTIEAVMPSMPPRRARADFVAAASMLDRFALTDLDGLVRLVHLDGDDQFDLVIVCHGVRPLAV